VLGALVFALLLFLLYRWNLVGRVDELQSALVRSQLTRVLA
jgi:hypothetical protein